MARTGARQTPAELGQSDRGRRRRAGAKASSAPKAPTAALDRHRGIDVPGIRVPGFARTIRDGIDGLDRSVGFAHLRDGAYTSAVEAGADLTRAKLLAGHRVGISDAYVKPDPLMVAGACLAIERHYFGGSAKPTRKGA